MPMLTLYHAPQTRSSRIVWLLEELGAPYEIVYTDIIRSSGGTPDPKNPHPDKKVPALVHDGILITESAAIVLYLTDLFPEADIGPRIGETNRGPYLTWLSYYAGVIEPVVAFQFAGLADNAGLARTFRGREEFHQRILDALDKGSYLLGEKFSGADILLASLGIWVRDMLPRTEAMDAYLERCLSRPALAAAGTRDAVPITRDSRG